MQRHRSAMGLILGDLLAERASGGIAIYAAHVGCHRSSLSRALCDPHRRVVAYVECVCALLWQLRAQGFVPRELLGRRFPADRFADEIGSGATDVQRAFADLFPEGYEAVLTDRLRLSRGGFRRATELPACRAYPHLRTIAHLLVILRDQGVAPRDALRARLPREWNARPIRDAGGMHDGLSPGY